MLYLTVLYINLLFPINIITNVQIGFLEPSFNHELIKLMLRFHEFC